MLTLTLVASLAFTAEGWVTPKMLRIPSPQRSLAASQPLHSTSRSQAAVLRSTSTAVENGIALSGLTNVAEDAEYLAQAVQAQLDNEWIPQVRHNGFFACRRKTL